MTKLGRIFIPMTLLAACLLVGCENEKTKETVTKKETIEKKNNRDSDDR